MVLYLHFLRLYCHGLAKKLKPYCNNMELTLELFTGQGLVRAQQVLAVLRDEGIQADNAPSASQERHEEDRIRPKPIPALRVPVRIEKLSRSKQAEVRYLTSSYYNTLTSVVTVAVPTRGLRAAVEQYAQFSGSPTAIMLFEAARLLRKYPVFNAFYARGAMHVYEEVNIGFAIDAGHGLKVPVLRQADTKSLQEIANEMRELPPQLPGQQAAVWTRLQGVRLPSPICRAEGVFIFPSAYQPRSVGYFRSWRGIFSAWQLGMGFSTLFCRSIISSLKGGRPTQFLQDLALPSARVYRSISEQPGPADVRERVELCALPYAFKSAPAPRHLLSMVINSWYKRCNPTAGLNIVVIPVCKAGE